MLLQLLRKSKNTIYKKIAPQKYAPTIIATPSVSANRPKRLSPKHDADLRFRIEMCITTGQVNELKQHNNDTEPLPTLLRSVIRDLDRLRQLAPAEEIKYRLLLLADQRSADPLQATQKLQATSKSQYPLP